MYNPYQLDHPTPTHKDYLDTTDFDQSEMLDMVKVSTTVRDFLKSGKSLNSLHHQTLAILFEQTDAYTQASASVAMSQLGGQALSPTPDMFPFVAQDALSDAAEFLSRMCDLLLVQSRHHANLIEFAAHSHVPVLGGMSDWNHPTQELSDIITIFDHLPEGKPLGKVKVVFVGDCTPTCGSLMMITSKMGMEFVQYAPPAKWLPDEYLKIGRANNQRYGGSVHVSDNPAILDGADFIYTDVWCGHGDQPITRDVYMRDFYPKYQVNDELLAATHNPDVKFVHYLPIHRGEEVTDTVLNSPHSIVWSQAENRLAAQRGLALYFGGVATETLAEIKRQKED